ncbi:helix-turn-helix domain-containing protein [Metallosphaera tengchongensis]|uniref:Helix-turn-helix domain-containing protein n=1 Tax=Metallosphaera tengchongensis TaxID=1532350 RepID=A0A6N0NXY6_9CREN|nr:transcriptional regulator [Metallosphaera tengchongensis]QKR00449.1 helix-turn-helix domain-containing protein [Metallosphaera tengchongensis]
MDKGMILVIFLSISLVPVVSSQVYLTEYYNGTVILDFYSPRFVIVPSNWTLISSHNISRNGNVLVPTTIPASAEFEVPNQGVINVSEPNVSKVFVILPINSKITYMSPDPVSLIQQGNLINISFDSGNVIVAYYLVDQGTLLDNPYLYTTGVSTGLSAYLAFLLWRRRPQPEVAAPNELDSRDAKILEAIRSGADNLNKISEISLLPRTTVYRRVKKLVALGLVEEVRERGRVRYVVKGEPK